MNKETLFSLLPLKTVSGEEIHKHIEEEQELVEAGKRFASRLSINRYLPKKLTAFTIDERIELFSELHKLHFFYDENALYFADLDIEGFTTLLEEKFGLKDIYTIDEFYIENLLQGKDITNETLQIEDEEMTFQQIMEQFVFTTFDMDTGDTPPLMLMLVVKKALLGSYIAEKNVEALQEGKTEIYDISVLM